MLVLSIDEKTKRCKSCGDMPEQAITNSYIKIKEFPQEHNISDYLYIDGEFVYNPLEQSQDTANNISYQNEEEPLNQFDLIYSQVIYTAMMTGTLIGG